MCFAFHWERSHAISWGTVVYAVRCERCKPSLALRVIRNQWTPKDASTRVYIAYLRQQYHISKFFIFQERLLTVLKWYNFLWVLRRHNCSPAASFANCVMTLYLLKVHQQTFLSIPITQKFKILSYDSLVANERYAAILLCNNCSRVTL